MMIILLFCLHLMARGQTIPTLEELGLPEKTQAKSMRYWFNDDKSSLQTSAIQTGKQSVDVSSLNEGIHTLHYQIVDTKKQVGPASSAIFMKLMDNSNSQAQSLRYWYDDDASSMQTSNVVTGVQTVDVSSLMEGIHTLHYQIVDTKKQVGPASSAIFMKLMDNSNSQAQSLRYWYDDDAGGMQTSNVVTGVQTLDVSSLMEGIHTLHYQIVDTKKQVGPASSAIFMKMSANNSLKAESFCYWFDDDVNLTKTAVPNGVKMLDVSQLGDGMHTVHCSMLCNDGSMTCVSSAMFFKMSTDGATTAKSLRYWYDDETTVSVIDIPSGVQQFDISRLMNGLHTVHCQILDNKGKVSSAESRIFYKDFDTAVEGGNRITKYEYWMNNDSKSMETVTLAKASNPYLLTALLPVKTVPIRSSCFHFEVTDGKPTIYAKNDFFIRFYDARGYFEFGNSPFIDYQVKQEITDVTLLESKVPQTLKAPTENTIKWYKVTASRGDSLSFRVSSACSVQLFSPSGEELYSVEGYGALSYGGANVPADGTYYLALHDATSRYSSNLTLEYERIGKYAVLSYTPNSASITTSYLDVKLNGNGYDKLASAELKIGAQVIGAKSINVQSKGSATLSFPIIGDEPTGKYTLRLGFKDGNDEQSLDVKDAIFLDNPDGGDIEVTVRESQTSKLPYTVTISITNKSNSGKNWVPFNIASTFNNEGTNSTVNVNESSWKSLYTMNFDVLNPSSDFIAGVGEGTQYSPYTFTDNLFGMGIPGVVLHGFIPTLGPYETKDYVIGFVGDKSQAPFSIYAWTGIPLNDGYLDADEETTIYSAWKYMMKFQELDNQHTRSITETPDYEGINTILDASDLLNESSDRANRNQLGVELEGVGTIDASSLKDIQISSSTTTDDPFASEILQNYKTSLRNDMPTPVQIAEAGSRGSSDTSGSSAANSLAILKELRERQVTAINGRPKSYHIDIYLPGDAIDIHGYTSDSGSKYIAGDHLDVGYTIEFVNDSRISKSSDVRTVIVRDTLDTSQFDMSTFKARSIKLGYKEVNLNGEHTISNKMIDLRPALAAIAKLNLSLDEQKGIVTWTIESYDPRSLNPASYNYQSILPLNRNGEGEGVVSFDIKLKSNLNDRDQVANRAGIVFDDRTTKMTTTWKNTVDAVPPVSKINDVSIINASTAVVSVNISDELSHPWRYDVYVQYGRGTEWKKAAENVPYNMPASVSIREGINHGFYVVATDSAGNVEKKQAAHEYTLTLGDDNEIETISISSAKQLTYYCDRDLDFKSKPELKAYVATGYDKTTGTIWLTRVKDVPAKTGFLLMGESGTYEVPVKVDGSKSYYKNLFKGTLTSMMLQATDGANTNYYLSNGTYGVGFYKVTKAGGVELKPNRAYLSVPTEIPANGSVGSTETISVSAAGQVPYYTSQNLDFTTMDERGVKAYTATGYDYGTGTIWLSRVKKVPAETGILVMAPKGDYAVPTASVASVYDNMFKGSVTASTIQTTETIGEIVYTNYYLSNGDYGVGFYKVTKEGGISLGANRCYLPIPNRSAATRGIDADAAKFCVQNSAEVIGIRIFSNGTTGIHSIENGQSTMEKDVFYNLQGQRVTNPGKGLYIKNGKKVVIK